MTRLGIIVATVLNNSVNLRWSKGLAWKWLRGLATNAALTSVFAFTCTYKYRGQGIFTLHTHYAVLLRFLIKTYERPLKTHGRIPLVLCQA